MEKPYNVDLIKSLQDKYDLILIDDPESIPEGPYTLSVYENTIEELCEMYPSSTIYVHEPTLPAIKAAILNNPVTVSYTPNPVAFSINNANSEIVLQISNTGKIMWREPATGELVQANVDSDLTQAFALSVAQIANISAEELIKDIRNKILIGCSVCVHDYLLDQGVNPEIANSVKYIIDGVQED